jgi:hypothetical protein
MENHKLVYFTDANGIFEPLDCPEPCTLEEFIEANDEDDEVIAAIPRLLEGEIVTFGGGAQPLVRVQLQ